MTTATVTLSDDARRSGLRRERVQASAQFHDGVFRNPTGVSPGLNGSAWPLLGEYFFAHTQRTPPGPLPLLSPIDTWLTSTATGFRVTWLGHSTVLLELDGKRVLTDPVFGKRASPLTFMGPKRFHPTPVSIEQLPPLDAIVLSHDHYDHLCATTIRELAKGTVPIITALGVGAHLERFGIHPDRISELDWDEHVQVAGLDIRATPSQHFSGRGTRDRNHTLWASWVITSERRKVFFSGDTGLTPQFVDIGKAYGPFDLVMLEIGAWNKAWGGIHLGPENALEAFAMLGGGTLLPVHWGTFNLALHAWDDPAETLVTMAAERGQRILTPRLGAAFEPEHVEAPDLWWREVEKARCGP